MRYEIQPELVTQHKLKWSLSLCMTIPPFAVNTFPVDHAGIMGNKEKILAWPGLHAADQGKQSSHSTTPGSHEPHDTCHPQHQPEPDHAGKPGQGYPQPQPQCCAATPDQL